jgi:hypothetical protein
MNLAHKVILVCLALTNIHTAAEATGPSTQLRLTWRNPYTQQISRSEETAEQTPPPMLAEFFAAITSDSEEAATNTIAILTQVINESSSLINALPNVVNLLMYENPLFEDQTALDVALQPVKDALLTRLIPSEHGNYGLLHLAAIADSALGDVGSAVIIVEKLLHERTDEELATALTLQDAWQMTPIHYAVFTTNDEAFVLRALLAGIEDTSILETVVTQQNIWQYSPVHYAAVTSAQRNQIFYSLLARLGHGAKFRVLMTPNRQGTTPFQLGLLYANYRIYSSWILDYITTQKVYKLLSHKNDLGLNASHFAVIGMNPLYSNTPADLDNAIEYLDNEHVLKLLNTKLEWGKTPIELVQLSDNNLATALLQILVLDPFFEISTIVSPTQYGTFV